MTILSRIACAISCLITAAAMWAMTSVVYEGLTVPKSVPIIGGEQIIDGIIARRLKGYVELSEKTALEAKLAREQRLRVLAEQSIANLRTLASEAAKAEQAAKAKLEKAIAEDKGDGGAEWTPDDLRWLHDNR